jgi:hypothetical protein
MYNNSSTLTDHILTSDEQSGMTTGSIIDDLSDHLITFCQLKFKNLKKKTKENLWSWLHLHWKDFLATDNVNDCYELFWTTFKMLYDLHIPVISSRLNRNVHKVN